MSNCYENFRTVLTMNLCQVLPADQLKAVLGAVDITMADFEISKKPMEIIPADGIPEVLQYFLASKAIANLSKGSLKQYRWKLTNFFDRVRKAYSDIQANDIRVYLYNFKIERNAMDSYVDGVRVVINTFFQWLVDNDYLNKNPCAKVEKIKYQPKRREAFSPLSLESLRWNCKTVREKALIDFLYSTGCRVSECSDVMLTDIDWTKNSVLIRHGKGDKERTVFFNDEAKVTMMEYLKTRNDSTPALWVSVKAPHQQIHAHAIEDIVRKIGKRTGVRAYPHKLRHTFATIGLQNGMSLDMLQLLMGHSKPETTLIYADHDRTQVGMEHRKAFS